ncbi:MAG TPA: tRNA pseudouridine(38-40) synthase TruA [Mycobacteriales bacterium]|nr:tRNA pseudouridine(38-40) synthase TruA [Mycobacteriales bacterium]
MSTDETGLPSAEAGLVASDAPDPGRAAGRAALNGPAAGAVRVRLDLAYDGSEFAGWAYQHDERTVQGELEKALATLARRADLPRVTVAGRTDAGVHARGQVAHVDLPPELAVDPLLLRRLNGVLPHDVRIRRVGAAPAGFDARFSGVSRTYRYRVADGPESVDPLRRHDTLAWPRPLDLRALQAASALLLGLRDFAAFCRRREGATTVRTLLRLEWERDADGVLVATVQADAFCHSMVRSLVGALLAVGEGRRPVEWPASLLSFGVRASEVAVAPAHALTLEHVEYPPDDHLLARQEVTRNLRA